jgi:hypothetical protein
MKKKQAPKYSQNTRYIILDKNQFDKDLLWTTKNKQKIKISTLISIYMNRASQKDSDKLCTLFGYERVKETVFKTISDELNLKEAVNQIDYFKIKKEDKSSIPSDDELKNILKKPKQRFVDYFCQKYSKEKLLEKDNNLKPKFPLYLQIKEMISYYEEEYLSDTSFKR